MKVLGIESSCDETGVALFDTDQGLLGHVLYSQIPIHAEYGGVVPELASRDHIRKLLPLTRQLFDETGVCASNIDAIAYTAGPGLAGALLVGASVGRALAWSWDIPALAVHHMEGHLLAAMLDDPKPEFPFLALLVSGGHTLLVDVKGVGGYQILGESLDDAVGEAFDKTAKLLGLPYPGGPVLAKLAEKGNPNRFLFPRPMTNRPGLDFSFSGLKTFARTTVKANKDDEQTKADIACAFEQAVVDTLLIKCQRALKQTGHSRLVIAGGVGANQQLRTKLKALADDENFQVFYPRIELCTDNGAMIAYAGACRLLAGEQQGLEVNVHPRWSLESLSSL